MRLSNYEDDGLVRVENWLQQQNEELNGETLRVILAAYNVSFVLEGINRWHSTMLCELKNSYVQQSQRYVTMSADGYLLPELTAEEKKQAEELLQQAFDLYSEMSVIKEEFKGRPKAEYYQYGIPVEDARYILPLAMQTNLSVAMSGDKLLDWFALFAQAPYKNLFTEIKDALLGCLPKKLGQVCVMLAKDTADKTQISDFYQEDLARITVTEPVVYLHGFAEPELKAGLGALTSTMAKAPSEVLAGWGEEWKEKSAAVVGRVLGYGHESIAEQARTTYGMMFSLVTYHQQVRHRLPSMYRENWQDLLADVSRNVVVPPTVVGSKFEEDYLALCRAFRQFQQQLAATYEDGRWMYFLLNCQQVKVVMSSNARMDCQMLRERICRNAQWEIRDIAERKLDLLRQKSSVLYRNALPPCVYGTCKEGTYTCGQAGAMRKKYAE